MDLDVNGSMSNLSEKLRKATSGKTNKKWKTRPEILLHPNIPKMMHQVCPRDILGRKWWNQTRKEAYASTDFHCIACGVHKSLAKSRQWLEGHELYETDYAKGRHKYIETVPLCNYCHMYIHSGRMKMLLECGKLSQHKYIAIIQHGDAVLAKAGLCRLEPYDGKIAEWGKWRLVLNRKLYPPKFKTYEQWLAAMSKSNSRDDE